MENVNHNQLTDENNQQQLIASNAKKDNKVKVFALIMVILGVSIGVGGYLADSASTSSSYSQSSYKKIWTALEDGSVHYGMSYEQIKAICGPARDLSVTNGVVEYAYYNNYQLCFINGYFYKWNY